MSAKWTKRLIGFLGILVSAVAVLVIVRKVNLRASLDLIHSVDYRYVVALMAVYLVAFLLRTARSLLMLARYRGARFANVLESIVVGYAGNNLLPARGGELVRMEFLSRKAGISRVSVLSYIAAERIIDGFSLLGILAASSYLAFHGFSGSGWLKNLTLTAAVIFIGLTVLMVLLRACENTLVKWMNRHGGRLTARIGEVVTKATDALRFMKFDLRTLLVFMLGFIIWITEGTMFVLGLLAFSITSHAAVAGYLCLAVVNFGLLVPSSPAFLGVFQGMTILALSLFAVPEETALSVSLLVHFSMIVPVSLWGVAIILKNAVKIF